MGAFLGAVFLVVGFVVLIERFALVSRSRDVITITRNAMATIRDPTLDDAFKESALQAHAKRLFGLFFAITFGAAAALTAPAALVWLLGRAGAVSFDEVMTTALSWPFIAAAGAFTLIYFAYRARRRA